MSLKTWRGYTIVDLLLILMGVTTIVIVGLVFSSQWFIICYTVLCLFCVFTQAKAKLITQILGIICTIAYSYISFTQQYYGEVIVNMLLLLPMYVYGLINWFTHKTNDSNQVIINDKLPKREWLILFPSLAVISVGIFFLLQLLNTAQLAFSTLSFITFLPALYLLIRRYKYNQVAFLLNDFIVPILWLTIAINGDLTFIPLFVYHIFQIIYDAYGIVEWSKLSKKQKNSN